jgi:hypothetical protein
VRLIEPCVIVTVLGHTLRLVGPSAVVEIAIATVVVLMVGSEWFGCHLNNQLVVAILDGRAAGRTALRR